MLIKNIIKIIVICVTILCLQCLKKDRISPTAYIIYPAENSNISGVVRIKVFATDNKEVTCVEFFINGVKKGVDSTASNAIYEYIWDVSQETPGNKIISAKAYDQAGNIGEAPSISVNVERPILGPTYHSGTLNQNQTWTKSQNPHIIIGTFEINAILSIEPGVIIKCSSNVSLAKIKILCAGEVIARGTSNEPILFTSIKTEPSPGDWYGIEIQQSQLTNTIFDNCVVEYAENGISLISRTISITNCLIHNNADYGVLVDNGRFTNFRNNTITRNHNFPISITVDAVYTLGPDNNLIGNFGINGLADAIKILTGYKDMQLKEVPHEKIPEEILKADNKTKIKSKTEEIPKIKDLSSRPELNIEISKKTIEIQDKTKILSKSGIQNNCRWRNHNVPYLITRGGINFEGPYTLTIEPGCILGFEDESKIVVNEDANLQADNVMFTSRRALEHDGNPGDWNGIEINEGSVNLQNCIIEYAGADESAIQCLGITENQSVLINNCTIRYSGGYGISLDEMSYEWVNIQITNTRIYGCEDAPVILYSVNLVRVLGTGNNFTGNEVDIIYVTSNGDIYTNSVWNHCCVPYIVDTDIYLYETWQGTPVSLTINPGCIIGFDGCGIEVGDNSILNANDVTFTSSYAIIDGQGSPGDWTGFYIADASLSLTNCIFEYAGTWTNSAINIEHLNEFQSILINNCIIRYIERNGLSLPSEEIAQNISITNTTISGCSEYPVIVNSADCIRAFGPGNNFSGNGTDAILVTDNGSVTTSGIWYNCGVPFLIETDIEIISGWQNNPPTITIMPGVVLKFMDTYLKVEEGALIADGSAGNIVFTADEETEFWSGIVFEDGTNDYLTRLNHCIVQYGGENNHNYGPANIVCVNSAPKIMNTQICHSRGWGIILRNSALEPDSLRRYNRFFNNDSGDIRVDTTKFFQPKYISAKPKTKIIKALTEQKPKPTWQNKTQLTIQSLENKTRK